MRAWLRLHAHALRDALRRFGAQPVASLFTVAVLAAAMALPVLAAMALRTLGAATAGLDTEPRINVFMALEATDEDAARVRDALRSDADASAVRFVPRAQALEELKSTTHLAEILATLDRNPLPHAFTVTVREEALPRIEALRARAAALPKVEQVTADYEWAQRLARWLRFGNRLLVLSGFGLALAVAFIVGHAIRLQVLTRREEIEVSQLVGATAADVRRPFLYHGLVQGILSGLGAWMLAAGAAAWLVAELSALTSSYVFEPKSLSVPLTFGMALVAGAGALGLAGAWVAVSSQLRRFSAG